MSIIYELLEAKLIVLNSEFNPDERTTLLRFLDRVERMVQDLDDEIHDLDEIPDAPAPSPVSSPSSSSSNLSSLPSLSSISTLLADPVMAVVRRIEHNTTEILNQVSLNTTNILSNSRDLDDLQEITERIQNRQRAQHLRVMEFISGVENHITDTLDLELERIRNMQNNLANSLIDQSERILNAMSVFDRANNYFIDQLNRLAGHPNI